MAELAIRWQRLVDEDGRTCERCGATGEALDGAVRRLARALGELGIQTVLETHTLDPAAFGKDPLESNRIWLAGRPLEDWLAATVGRSACCSACGDSECRTVTVDGTTYEAIAPELILEAGLLAAAHVLRDRRVSGSGGGAGCCSADDPPSGCGEVGDARKADEPAAADSPCCGTDPATDSTISCSIRCLDPEVVEQAARRLDPSGLERVTYTCQISGTAEELLLIGDRLASQLAETVPEARDAGDAKILAGLHSAELCECDVATLTSLPERQVVDRLQALTTDGTLAHRILHGMSYYRLRSRTVREHLDHALQATTPA